MQRTEFRAIQLVVLSAGLILAAFYGVHTVVTLDHLSMMDRGYLLLMDRIWIPYGNPSSGGLANTPGYLSTLVAGLPLLAWNSMYAPVVMLVLLQLVSYVLLDDVVRRSFDGYRIRALFLVIYWLNPWLLSLTTVWNPSYLVVLSALHLWSASMMYGRKSFWISFLHVLSVGLAVQFHMSAVILGLVSIFMLYKGLIRVDWVGLVAAVVVIALSLVPFILAAMDNWLLIEGNDYGGKYYFGRSVVHVYPVLKSVLYWLRYGSLLFSSDIVFQARFEWLTDMEIFRKIALWCWWTVTVGVGAASVVLSAKASWRYFSGMGLRFWRPGSSKVSASGSDYIEWLRWYCFGAFLAVVLSAILSPITFNYWHLLIIFPAALFPLLMLYRDSGTATRVSRFLQSNRFLGVLAAYLVAVNLVASHDSERFSYQADYASQMKLEMFQLKDRR